MHNPRPHAALARFPWIIASTRTAGPAHAQSAKPVQTWLDRARPGAERVCVKRVQLTLFVVALAIACAASLLGGCGGNDEDKAVTITAVGPNAVSYWTGIASATINVPASSTGTAEEQRPTYAVDLATVHVAIYDAVMAIAGTHQPYAITPTAASSGASQEAAIGAAAYRVLLGLFPNRTAQYQGAYDTFVQTIPDGPGKTQGIAIGTEVAVGILALRANDGRSVVLSAYAPGTAAGDFRGTAPINRYAPFIKPFSLTSLSQFRAPVPPALASTTYAADLNETSRWARSRARPAPQTRPTWHASERSRRRSSG
jgi:hypothetical protein